jgi:hypothetical protein
MYTYTPNEDPVFESLKTHIVDESNLDPLLISNHDQSRPGNKNGMYGYEWGDRYPKPMLNKTHSDETKRKWSEKRKGVLPWNTGISLSKETKQKMSESKIGIPRPDVAESNKKRKGMKYKRKVKSHPTHLAEDDTYL